MTVLVNGEPGRPIEAADRGLQFGDGVFETLRLSGGRPTLWARHWTRLCAGLDRLGIPRPREQDCLDELARVSLDGPSMAKLIVTRGPGPRGYAPPAHAQPTRIVMGGAPLDIPGPSDILRLGVCRTRVARSPIPGCKHLNRLENVLARREWAGDWDEGLMRDSKGLVRCGTQSNVFVLEDGVLLTPGLAHHGVAGTRRGWLLENADAFGLKVRETNLTLERMRCADAVFLTNARLGLCRAAFVSGPERPTQSSPRTASVLNRIREIGEHFNALD
jgi:4-amino-4-deoxychorismate lyase